MSLTWAFEVRWDGTNWTDEASRMRGLRVKRGRANYVAAGGRGLEPMRPGEAVVELLNTSDRYNPYNTSSPLYGDIAPGKLVRLKVTSGATTYPVLYGRISSIQVYAREGLSYARIVVRDGLEYLQEQTIWLDCNFGSGGASSDRFAGNIGNILTAASWPWSTSLSGSTDYCTWWGGDNYETPAAKLIWELRESDLGEFYVARDGTATYLARLTAMPAATVTLDDDDLQLDYEMPMPWEMVRNDCVVQSSRWYNSANYVALWKWRHDVRISNGNDFDSGKRRLTYDGMWAAGDYASLYRIRDDEGDWSGNWDPPDVSPSSYVTGFVDVEIENTSGNTRTLREVDLYFNPGAWFDLLGERATDNDATSVAAYGKRSMTLQAKWRFHSDSYSAADMAATVVGSLKDPKPYPTVRIVGDAALQFARELRECIAINSTTLRLSNVKYHTGQIEHRWLDETGQVVETTIKTEPALVAAEWSGDAPGGGGDTPTGTSVTPDPLDVSDLTATGTVTIGDGSELTIASGAVTATSAYHVIDTESDAASDDLDTINGAATGRVLVIGSVDSARDVVVKDGTGNLHLAGDMTLGHVDDRLTLFGDGDDWYEVSRSDNG